MFRSQFFRIFGGIGVILFSVLATHYSFIEVGSWIRRPPVFVWGLFHYSINAKYFRELEYTHLYECAVEAQKEVGKPYVDNELVRDLTTYELVEVRELPACPRSRFSDARWASFVHDVDGYRQEIDAYPLTALRKHTYWAGMIMDKGYNAPPTLVVASQWAVRASEWFGSWQYSVLTSLDVVFALLGCVIAWRVFGMRAAFFGLLAACVFWGTAGHLIGHFLQHAWLVALIGMFAAIRTKRWQVAGACLAVACTTRVFPVVFLLPLMWKWATALKRKNFQDREALDRLLIACGIVATVFVIVGLYSGLGVEGWVLFLEKMHRHSTYIVGELFDTGLKTFVSGILPGAEGGDVARLVAYAPYAPLVTGFSVLVTLRLLYRYRNVDLLTMLLLSLPFAYILLVISPFYWLMYSLVPLIVIGCPDLGLLRSRAQAATFAFFCLILFVQTRYVIFGLEFTDQGLSEHRLDAVLHLMMNLSILLLIEGVHRQKRSIPLTTA